MNNETKEKVLSWFTGKARIDAITALHMLEDSEKAGEWIPGASRFVRTRLGKSNVARKIGHEHRAALERIGDHKTPANKRGWTVAFMLQFGLHNERNDIDWAAIHDGAMELGGTKIAVERAHEFYDAFVPINQLMDRLDATRSKPVFTNLGVSPTISKTLEQLNFHYSSPDSIRLCPMRWEREQTVDKDGKTITVPVYILNWPADTVYGASRFGENGNPFPGRRCHSCGHAIKNPYNWVPLIVDDSNGVPHALWVGSDCAKRVFGIQVKGDIRIRGMVS